MKPRKWTIMEEQIMRNEWNRRTIDEIAKMLGRSYQATAVKASKIGLKKDHYGIVWTQEQLKLLRDYFPTMFNKPLAAWIGVSMRTMIRKARELGLEKKPGFLDERRKDISALAAESLKKSENVITRFKKGVRNNPAGEFKPGHVESPETKAKRSEALKHSWKKRKARLELDKNLHPEKYF
jgi:hypothetical protein